MTQPARGGPTRAGDAPLPVQVKEGKSYWWCSCGLSKNQPFCDGSHKAEDVFAPVEDVADKTKTVFFCTCKATNRAPLCDGSHNPK
jgi:CDGSH iron-sulfur domain-containing protein 3